MTKENYKPIECCDVCGKKTKNLSDYFAMLCPDCKSKHTDIVLLKRIGVLMNEKDERGMMK